MTSGHSFYTMLGDTVLGSHRKKNLTAICGYVNAGRDNQAARRDGRNAPATATVPTVESPALNEQERNILEIMIFSKPYGSRYTTRTNIYRQDKAQLAIMVGRGLIRVAEHKGLTVLYLPTDAGLAALQRDGQKTIK